MGIYTRQPRSSKSPRWRTHTEAAQRVGRGGEGAGLPSWGVLNGSRGRSNSTPLRVRGSHAWCLMLPRSGPEDGPRLQELASGSVPCALSSGGRHPSNVLGAQLSCLLAPWGGIFNFPLVVFWLEKNRRGGCLLFLNLFQVK